MEEWFQFSRPDINRSQEHPKLKSTILLIAAPLNTTFWNTTPPMTGSFRLLHGVFVFTTTISRVDQRNQSASLPRSWKAPTLDFCISLRTSRIPGAVSTEERPSSSEQLLPPSVTSSAWRWWAHSSWGRLANSDHSYESAHPIILDKSSRITKLLVYQVHSSRSTLDQTPCCQS